MSVKQILVMGLCRVMSGWSLADTLDLLVNNPLASVLDPENYMSIETRQQIEESLSPKGTKFRMLLIVLSRANCEGPKECLEDWVESLLDSRPGPLAVFVFSMEDRRWRAGSRDAGLGPRRLVSAARRAAPHLALKQFDRGFTALTTDLAEPRLLDPPALLHFFLALGTLALAARTALTNPVVAEFLLQNYGVSRRPLREELKRSASSIFSTFSLQSLLPCTKLTSKPTV